MNRKVEKKIRRKKVFFSLSFFIIFLGVLCLFLFKSNYFNIAAVSVENNNIVSADEIKALAKLEGENIFLVDLNQIEKKVQYNPYIDSVEIIRKYPNKITIRVREKKIMGLVKYKNVFINIDNEGNMIQTVDKFPDCKIPLIEGIEVKEYIPKKPILKSDDVKLKALKSAFKVNEYKEYKNLIYSIDISDPYNISYKTKDGIVINVGDFNNMEYKLACAYSVLKSNIPKKSGYIQINSDGTAIYKNKK